MIEARAAATVPATPAEVFAAATDLDHADWLPAVRRVRRLAADGGDGVGARYAVEAGLLGRHLSGVLVCRVLEPPSLAVFELEDGLDLTITIRIREAGRHAHLELAAGYSVRGGLFGGAAERASAGAARREVARAVEQLSARFGHTLHGHPRA